ncbi:MAG TPA: SDR family oxidoreductase, partial [Kofleriaceae bacterium]|nr:SDR family oxidoreductase [Kofleriaceae bacterium]
IGRALAERLAAGGARLTLAARNLEQLEEVAEACRVLGGQAIACATDVTDANACGRMVDLAVEAFGGIDVLVNNAGIGMTARFDQVTDLTIFERLMQVNYLGAVYCTWHALPHLTASGGLICAVSSLTGKTGVPTRSGYAASKHAMQGFFDSLRVELRNTGVDVLVVSPGFVATDIRARVLGPDGAPLGASARDESRGTMSVDTCVDGIIGAMRKRRRELVMTAPGKVGLVLKLMAPGLVDRLAARAVDDPGR